MTEGIPQIRPSNNKIEGFPTEPLGILYFALRARIGVVLRTPNATKAREQLYSARKASLDPELNRLVIREAPDGLKFEGTLVITKVEEKRK